MTLIRKQFTADVLAEAEPATHAADDGEGGGEDAPASLADTQSTAARKDVQREAVTTDLPAGAPKASDTAKLAGGTVPRPPKAEVSEVRSLGPAGTQAPPVDTHSEPGNGLAGEKPVVATRQGGEEPGTLGSLSAAPSNIVHMAPAKPLRPYCQHLDDLTKCGGYGKQHCGECLRARERQVEVVPGGVEIPHHGTVRA